MSAEIIPLRAPLRLPPRKDIETAIETLVALLDAIDPDPDREDDAGIVPIYGIDQTAGPVNV